MQEKKSHAYSEHSWALNLVIIPKKQYNTYLHCTIVVSGLEMIEHVLEGAHRLYAHALPGTSAQSHHTWYSDSL